MASETSNFIDRGIDPKAAKVIGRALKLNENQYNKIVEAGELRPSLDIWLGWLDRVLLVAAAAFLLSGVLCFVSYNWAGLHKLLKFTLLEVALLVTIAMAWYKGIQHLSGKVLLFSGAVIMGFCLAVFGQVYQTGADPYGLFLVWLIFVTAWAIIGRQPGLYVLFVVLSNLTLIFYWNQMVSPPSAGSVWISSLFGPLVRLFFDSGRSYLPLLVLALNFLFVVIHEHLAKKDLGPQGSATIRVSGMAGIIPVTASAVILLFDNEWQSIGSLLLVVFFVTIVAGLWYFRFKNRDLFLTSGILLALIVFVTSFLVKFTNFGKMGIFSFFFIGVAVLLQTGAAAYWLRISNAEGRATR